MGNSPSTNKPSYRDKIIFSKKITNTHPDTTVQTENYTITFVTDSSKTFIYLYKNEEQHPINNNHNITDITAYGTWTQDETGRFTLTGQQTIQKNLYVNNDDHSDQKNKSTTLPFVLLIDDIYEWQQSI